MNRGIFSKMYEKISEKIRKCKNQPKLKIFLIYILNYVKELGKIRLLIKF